MFCFGADGTRCYGWSAHTLCIEGLPTLSQLGGKRIGARQKAVVAFTSGRCLLHIKTRQDMGGWRFTKRAQKGRWRPPQAAWVRSGWRRGDLRARPMGTRCNQLERLDCCSVWVPWVVCWLSHHRGLHLPSDASNSLNAQFNHNVTPTHTQTFKNCTKINLAVQQF